VKNGEATIREGHEANEDDEQPGERFDAARTELYRAFQ
jgi:hypothetical protein